MGRAFSFQILLMGKFSCPAHQITIKLRQKVFNLLIGGFFLKGRLYQFDKIASIFPTQLLYFIPVWKD